MKFNLKKFLAAGFIISLNIFMLAGEKRVKKTAPDAMFDISEDLPAEDFEKGLRILTSAELMTLNQFIEGQSEMQMEDCFQNKRQTNNKDNNKNLLGIMEDYWTRHHVNALESKRKRNIDDLYDEVAHANGESQMKSDKSDDFSEMEAQGCTCRSVPSQWDEKNMRAKRENQYAANLDKGYSLEEYVRDLENSFPRDQGEKNQCEDGGTGHKGHFRIKRL